MFPPFLRPSFGNLLLLYHKNIITILQASDDGGGDIFTPFSLCSNVFRSVEGKSILLPVLVVMLNEKPALQQPLTLLSIKILRLEKSPYRQYTDHIGSTNGKRE